jgi:hypothetical protein
MRGAWASAIAPAVDRSPNCVFGGCIAWMLELRGFVIIAAPAAIPKVAGGPWCGIVVRQVDTTVVPWVAVRIEASC